MDFPYTSTIFSVIAYLKLNKRTTEKGKKDSLLISRCRSCLDMALFSYFYISTSIFSESSFASPVARSRALELYHRAADRAGQSEAQYMLGVLYGNLIRQADGGSGEKQKLIFSQTYGYILRNFDKFFGILKNSVCNIILIKIFENLQNSAEI